MASRSEAVTSSGICAVPSGDEGIRTPDPLLARQVLSQLSYTPISAFFWLLGFLFRYGFFHIFVVLKGFPLVGLSGLEPPTSRLSGVRSNRLSYKPSFLVLSRQPPALPHRLQCSTIGRLRLNLRVRDGYGCLP